MAKKKPAAKTAKKAAKKPATKKPAVKAVAKKSAAKKAAPKRSPANSKAAPKKAAAKKTVLKNTGVKKAAAKMPTAKTVKKAATKSQSKSQSHKSKAKMTSSAKAAIAIGAAAVAIGAAVGTKKALKSAVNFANLVSPLDDRVIVEVEEVATRTPGGLFIPDSVDRADRHKQGKVVAVGRGHVDSKGKLRPLDVKLGDTVLFDHYMGSALEISGQDVIVVRESQLLGVVKG